MAIILQSKTDINVSEWTSTETEMVWKLRCMLKDLPYEEQFRSLNTLVEKQRDYRWSDQLLLTYIQIAMNDINSTAPVTSYVISAEEGVSSVLIVPPAWHGCILLGAFILACMGETVSQIGETFSYSDNGISLTLNQASLYQSAATAGLAAAYQTQKENLKKTLRPMARGLRQTPIQAHIRSYAPRMWCYR